MKKPLTKKQIDFLDRVTKKCDSKWKLTVDGLVDVNGNFDISKKRFKTFSGIKFGVVTGSFDCSLNQLTSLVGAPQSVGEDFDCSNNKLTSLEGAPQKVGGSFCCSHNKLTSLEGAPQEVEKDFYCSHNKLTNLVGAPQEVNGDFYCYSNKLTSLQGAPQKVGGSFGCDRNKLTSLEGAPQEVKVHFDCSENKLTSFEGAPQKVGGSFDCYENPICKETLELIFEVMQTKGLEYKLALSSVKSKIPSKEWELLSKDVKFVSEDEELGVRILGRIL